MKEPRSGSVAVGNIPWLGRMIDKARLEAAGEIDVFDLDFPCPMDQRLLHQLNVSADSFQKIAVAASSDEEILAELDKIGANLSLR